MRLIELDPSDIELLQRTVSVCKEFPIDLNREPSPSEIVDAEHPIVDGDKLDVSRCRLIDLNGNRGPVHECPLPVGSICQVKGYKDMRVYVSAATIGCDMGRKVETILGEFVDYWKWEVHIMPCNPMAPEQRLAGGFV